MKGSRSNIIAFCSFFLILIISIIVLWFYLQSNKSADINNFEDCMNAGNPVMESYPRQCNTDDGKHFVEEVE